MPPGRASSTETPARSRLRSTVRQSPCSAAWPRFTRPTSISGPPSWRRAPTTAAMPDASCSGWRRPLPISALRAPFTAWPPLTGIRCFEIRDAPSTIPDPMSLDRTSLIPALRNVATRLRIDSVRSTSEAGTGHPTTCCSAADLLAVLFFAEMRFDPKDPKNPESDRFVLSKGHAAPILYSAWAEAGAFDRAELMKLREIGSDLEGHPTPRLPFVDVATGSLGQGI